MRVTAEIITGAHIETNVGEDATVKDLKEKIASAHGLPLKRLIFVIGDEEMRRRVVNDSEDESLLKELGVRDGSHMYVFFKHLEDDDNSHCREDEEGRGGYVSIQDVILEVERRWDSRERVKVKEHEEKEEKEEETKEEEEEEEERKG